jgi:hypothetical protein
MSKFNWCIYVKDGLPYEFLKKNINIKRPTFKLTKYFIKKYGLIEYIKGIIFSIFYR